MNPTRRRKMLKVLSMICKLGACYYLIRMDDMMFQAVGVVLALGFILEQVDLYKNGNIMNNKGVENVRRN
tara:strand:+ start:1827 stop:2036 length:210 start_codon:yes stop_codon:yes gene_type:complete